MYGFCSLPLIPLRASASHSSEMVDQLLFGDTYELLSQTEEWCEVALCRYQYHGWISLKQHTPITDNEKKLVELWPAVVGEPFAAVTLRGKATLLPMGSRLPREAEVTVANIALQHTTTQQQSIATPLESALKLFNAPYLWGGKSCMGIDCSGLTQTTFRVSGAGLPRDASQQALAGREITSLAEATANDLMFFHNEAGKIVHVGIYMGDNKIIHASGRVRIDTVDNIGIMNCETGQYSHKLCSIRRITL